MPSDASILRQKKLRKLEELIKKYKAKRTDFVDVEDRQVLKDRINWLEVEKLDIESEDLHDDNGSWTGKIKSFEPVIKEVHTRPEVMEEVA